MELKLFNQDNIELLKTLPDNSIDSIVTDPPYGISFMGKKWDYDVPSVETWKECLRVLKPGGHILVACGTRTQHRMTVNIEDAGFEIRDIVAWIYGSGFPKSLNIGKAVDKLQGNEREVVGVGMHSNIHSFANSENYSGTDFKPEITKGNSPYEGWGTALKPAMELWTMARKPLSEKNVAENVLKWGTGGINIDGSRIQTQEKLGRPASSTTIFGNGKMTKEDYIDNSNNLGRFPANVIHDGSDEVTDLFPINKHTSKGIRGRGSDIYAGGKGFANTLTEVGQEIGYGDSGSASRFFYCAKASKSERNAGCEHLPMKAGGSNAKGYTEDVARGLDRNRPTTNFHPTVKPVALMRYLVKMITPAGGMVLDPFMGSGSTGVACMKENFSFTGIELDPEYFKIAEARINNQLE